MNVALTGNADETKRVGEALARCLRAGDVILLKGELGAGKTQFVQGVAAGLGVAEVPTSPTFNIVLTYHSGRLALHHFDLYRLETDDELEDIGIAEYLESGGVCFVEWAEKFPGAFQDCLAVEIAKVDEATRTIDAVVGSRSVGRAAELLDAWKVELGSCVAVAPRAATMLSPARVEFPDRRCGHDNTKDEGIADGGHSGEAHGGGVSGSGWEDGGAEGIRFPNPDRVDAPVLIAFDTANEVVALGVGVLDVETKTVAILATREIEAHRASNTRLLPSLDELLGECGVERDRVAGVCVGRGPGSFTGVRIAMATAKGIASALGVGLVGVSSLDAVAWNAWSDGMRGDVLVVADAMRKEVYPAHFALTDGGAERMSADCVVKADAHASGLVASSCSIMGDGLVKYRDLYEGKGRIAPERLWCVTGQGLLCALQDAWRAGEADPLDALRHNPAYALPVYTRLSDAEENERIRLSKDEAKNLVTGVQDVTTMPSSADGGFPSSDGGVGRATMHMQSMLTAPAGADGIAYHPLDARHVADVALLERETMGTDAWSERLIADELSQKNRTWWVAEAGGRLAGYAGGLVVDGDLQVLKVAVDPAFRRRGIACELLARVADDARNLAATSCSLEVRASNVGAQAFYQALGLDVVGVRPRYYSDREDAVIMNGALPSAPHDVAGMELKHLDCERATQGVEMRDVSGVERPLILAIESSCDETAAAVVDGRGELLSDVVASQIDFHARFGGVVPEIASRKHIEAICGVCEEALAVTARPCAAEPEDVGVGSASPARVSRHTLDPVPHGEGELHNPSVPHLAWRDLDAVAVTYAPGLVGALVVGVAFAKGVAWALDVPFIGVNHLEGHLYANKVDASGFEPPAVVSLVSGGNTMLVHMRGWGDYVTLGTTIDDAVGEAFDKVAKALGLGYPGGPVISAQAAMGNPAAIDFPRAMLHSRDLRFSLSGLKTAVVNYINKERQAGRALNVADIAASFQQAVVDVQVAKAKAALEQTGAPTFCLGGGVAANPVLRAAYEQLCERMGVRLVMPPLASCGDNAGMIALVALDRYVQGKFFDLSADAYAHADLDEPY